MDLATRYLGFTLPHPIMPGASPLTDDLDAVRRLEDAGAAAVVMRSVFEEQITRERLGIVHDQFVQDRAARPVLSYFPRPEDYALSPSEYLEHIQRVRAAVSVPVIASLNATRAEGWLDYARLIEQAGADALELNFYHLATDPREDAAQVEHRLLEMLRGVRQAVTLPIAVKILPFFSSLSHLAHDLDSAGAAGLVLFNRLYQPDIDPEMLDAPPRLRWSTSADLLLRVRWIAILSGQVDASLAATGGIHTGLDAVKVVLAGAHAIQVVASLLEHGPRHIALLRRELARWLERHDYESLRQAQGSLSLLRCPDPEAFERGSYLRALQTWRQ